MISRAYILLNLKVVFLFLFIFPCHGLPVYFLVGEIPGTEVLYDSYVLSLSEEADIQHARDLIQFGPEIGDAIVVASIAEGADGINRNWLAQGAPEWSWHVTEFLGFAWATIEILDGSPTIVEEDIDWWMQNTGGKIGFWGYTIIAELPQVPEPSQITVGFAGFIAVAVILFTRRKY